MIFKLRPILDEMEKIYLMPRNRKRFEAYLLLLQGESKDDMLLPIAGYNPMGKELALNKLRALKALKAEGIIAEKLQAINKLTKAEEQRTIEVVINLSDDVEGSWSSRFTSDYSSRFDFGPILKRDFCTPYFWTSENFTETFILQRTSEYVLRSWYWHIHGKPSTLKQCLDQEVFVQERIDLPSKVADLEVDRIKNFVNTYADSEDYHLLFNFFYGDKASEGMAYPSFGMETFAGFEYAKFLAKNA